MILPDFKNKKCAYWNTDRWAFNLSNELDTTSMKSPFLKHKRKERLSENAKRVLGVDYLYGGWLEDRSYIWRGSYMEPSKFLHLGTDFVAPIDSKVAVDRSCRIVQIYCDTPEEAGWGTRIMVKLIHDDIHLVYGHLSAKKNVLSVGDILHADDIIGYIGGPDENGGWSPHLHVQAITGSVDEFLKDPASLDGYGELSDFENLVRRFPDPIKWIEIR